MRLLESVGVVKSLVPSSRLPREGDDFVLTLRLKPAVFVGGDGFAALPELLLLLLISDGRAVCLRTLLLAPSPPPPPPLPTSSPSFIGDSRFGVPLISLLFAVVVAVATAVLALFALVVAATARGLTESWPGARVGGGRGRLLALL